MDKGTRNRIQTATQKARARLEDELGQQLEGVFDIRPDGTIGAMGPQLTSRQRMLREKILVAIEHERFGGRSLAEAVAAYTREAAFTTLNRFVALRMLEARELLLPCLSSGEQSGGFKEYAHLGLADGLVQLDDRGYRLYIESLFDEVAREVGVLFDRRDPASLLWPRHQALTDLLTILGDPDLAAVWSQDEAIGWVYQFFNLDDERKAMRDPRRGGSQAPRTSGELAVRNQFFTPRYVVEFLTDNTLGRLWWEMRCGRTRLAERCGYLVRRPGETFLTSDTQARLDTADDGAKPDTRRLPGETVCVAPRDKKDPRDLRVLDPACGSGHFLLYAFDLLMTIYVEAWEDEESPASSATGASLREDYAGLAELTAVLPSLILRYNLYGIDIDERCAQIAALALWMRAQRAYAENVVDLVARSAVKRTNVVVAEPMPGEPELRAEFLASLSPDLSVLFERILHKMELAGESGPLLRIEAEIGSAIREVYGGLGGLFAESDEVHWREAEAQLAIALRDYANRAGHGDFFGRKLFSDDAARGLAFIDLCRQRYDVVLTNPPFGEAPDTIRTYLGSQYPTWNGNILCAFLERAAREFAPDGFVGAVIDRTAAIKTTYERFRRSVVLDDDRLAILAELGWGVLDANVEVAALVMSSQSGGSSRPLFDVASAGLAGQADALISSVACVNGGAPTDRASFQTPQVIRALPNAVLSASFPSWLLRAFTSGRQLTAAGFEPVVGHSFVSDEHFRLFWEIPDREPLALSTTRWTRVFNGGEYSPLYMPLREVACYGVGASLISSHPSVTLRNLGRIGQAGVGYGKRGDYLDAQILPPDYALTVEGEGGAVGELETALGVAALLSSKLFGYGINLYCGQHKYPGYVSAFPLTERMKASIPQVADLARRVWEIKADWQTGDETDVQFCGPWLFHLSGGNLSNALAELADRQLRANSEMRALWDEINRTVVEAYSLTSDEARDLDSRTSMWPIDTLGYGSGAAATGTLPSHLADAVSYAVGVVFGRWIEDPGPLVDLCGQRLESFWHGLPRHQPARSAERRETVSILVDDPGLPADITSMVRQALPSNCSDSEISAVLAGSSSSSRFELRQWLSRSFFDYHVKRYTRRRRAPIYWQFGPLSPGYSIWLYYPSLTTDTFYRVLHEVVTPKVQHEERVLNELMQTSSSRSAAGWRRDVDTQQALVQELRVFRQEIARIAPLWSPDLNDGVIVNFAPLWRLVPQHRAWQKECKSCWDKLVAGDHDWSHLAMHLWPERVLRKCAANHNLAVTHGLEEVLWTKGADGKSVPRNVDDAAIERLVQERSSSAVQAAVADLVAAQ